MNHVGLLLSPVALLCTFALAATPDAPPPASAQRAERDSTHDVMESAFCAKCHPAIYAEHAQSTHGRAFTDSEVRLATARFAHGDCIICHTPRPIFETGVGQNPRRRLFGLEEGITCMTCHWRDDYEYDQFTGGAECVEAFHPDVGTVEACASCHRNHGTPYQWEKAPAGQQSGRACMDCHMSEIERPVAVGGAKRDVRSHIFPGARSESQVRRAYRYRAEIEGNEAVITVANRGTGHNFPTELKQRSVESLVIIRDLEGNEIATSRLVFRDPYKRPYGLQLPVNTQIPSGETREHRIPIGVASGTVECKLFFKLYYPIDDYHSDLSRVLESRVLPFDGIEPSEEPVPTQVEIRPVAPEGIEPELASPANLVDFARPPIGEVDVDIPTGDSPADIQRLIELFQFPVPEGNRMARARLAKIGLPAVPALIDALGSWDNKTYNQALKVLEKIGIPARPAVLEAFEDERLYVRLHARELTARNGWKGDDVIEALAAALDLSGALDRASAAGAVGKLRIASLGDNLVPLLNDEDPDVVLAAAKALADLGRKDAVEAMEAALHAAPFEETRHSLAHSLARLSSPAGIPELLLGLDHDDDLIREAAFEKFFEATGVHLGFDPLAARPERLESLAALQSFWAKEGGASKLLPVDPDRDPWAEAHAWGIVTKLGGSDYLEATEEDVEFEAELVGMGKYAVPALIKGLKYPPGFAAKRVAICRALGRIGDRRAAPALGATLRDPVLRVASWAAWGLEGAGDSANLTALRRYEQRLHTAMATGGIPVNFGSGERALAQAARTRLLLGDATARNTLAGLLLSEDAFTRELSFDALERHFGEARGYDPEADAASRRSAAVNWMR